MNENEEMRPDRLVFSVDTSEITHEEARQTIKEWEQRPTPSNKLE